MKRFQVGIQVVFFFQYSFYICTGCNTLFVSANLLLYLVPVLQQCRIFHIIQWNRTWETFLLNTSNTKCKRLARVCQSLKCMQECACVPKHSHRSDGAAAGVSVCEHADVCVAKQWDEKGKCDVIGTCGRQKELNFQYSSWMQPISAGLLCVMALVPSGAEFCQKQPCWSFTIFTSSRCLQI